MLIGANYEVLADDKEKGFALIRYHDVDGKHYIIFDTLALDGEMSDCSEEAAWEQFRMVISKRGN